MKFPDFSLTIIIFIFQKFTPDRGNLEYALFTVYMT